LTLQKISGDVLFFLAWFDAAVDRPFPTSRNDFKEMHITKSINIVEDVKLNDEHIPELGVVR